MTSSPTPHRRARLPRWTAALAAGLLAAAALLVPALPAAAHDELVSTDPSADAVLDALPAQITFTFSADVLTDAGATVVEVKDASGASLADGAPEVSGTTVTQSLAGAASGAVSVVWRVVSSDGHPISGDFAFTVPAAAPTPSATPTTTTPAVSPTPSATSAPSADPTSSATAAPVDEASAPSPLPWILLAVILVIVAGVLVYVFASRSGRKTAGGGTAGR
ncbi:copper resistance CopC family protein [Microbacterium sp. BH-3-3-3]|uniref:copper resistance CopC family protein n=1 Tax=Microbacterium sp. BH-3-3-3 TaxID=1906742 RepID=UPI0021B6BA29|nr:copper resistance CopC family protein [Microbacterium sp. BH-3-3-3]